MKGAIRRDIDTRNMIVLSLIRLGGLVMEKVEGGNKVLYPIKALLWRICDVDVFDQDFLVDGQ